MSKGINPKFVSKDTKISHAKSSSFIKWKQDHQFESVESLDEDALLDKFLMSRGINPKYVTKDMKISHAKSGQFIKWKRDHMVEELTEAGKPSNKMTTLQKFRADAAAREKKHDDIEKEMKARHAAGKEDMKGSIDRLEKQLNKEEIEHKVGDSVTVNSKFFGKQKGKVTKVDSQSVHVVRDGKSSAEKYPHDAVVKEEIEQIDELNYDTVKSLYKKRRDDFHGAQIGKKKKGKEVSAKNVSRSISRLTGFKPTQNQPQKEEFELNEVSSSEVQHHFDNWTNSEHAPYNSDAGNDNKVHQSALRYLRSTNVPKDQHEKMAMHIAHKFHGSGIDEAAGISKTKETSFHKKLDKLVHNTFGKRKDEMKMKEKVEQIDELKKSTVFSWLKQQPVVPVRKPGSDRVSYNQKVKNHSKSWNRALDRLSGYKPTSEDVYQDSQAATQTAFDMGTTPNQTEPTYSRKKEMSKSARIIKSIYKNKRMVKEDMYDHEKEDKSIQTYGKKPKVMEPDEKKNLGEKKPEARIVMSGGTTLTGEKRDTVEIDPAMKVRPGPDTFGATGKKASQQ
jgi:hypothetical protein